jgi:hypothetical protein
MKDERIVIPLNDPELSEQCRPLLAQPDGAAIAFSATKVLEQRLRALNGMTNKEKGLVERSLGPSSVFHQLPTAFNASREHVKAIVGGIVGLYRNPGAHAFPCISKEEGLQVLALVDLVLEKLSRFSRALNQQFPARPRYQLQRMVMGDFDGDGHKERMLLFELPPNEQDDHEGEAYGVLVRQHPKLESVCEIPSFPTVFGLVDARAVDADGDGCQELAIATVTGAHVLELALLKWDQARFVELQRWKTDGNGFVFYDADDDGLDEVVVLGRDYDFSTGDDSTYEVWGRGPTGNLILRGAGRGLPPGATRVSSEEGAVCEPVSDA